MTRVNLVNTHLQASKMGNFLNSLKISYYLCLLIYILLDKNVDAVIRRVDWDGLALMVIVVQNHVRAIQVKYAVVPMPIRFII